MSAPSAPVVVIGAGMAGMAATSRLSEAGAPVVMLEGRDHLGGHTASLEREGFVFDEGPHVSFTKDAAVVDLFARGAGELVEFKASITNAYKGHWVRHPAQCHLHGLPPDLVARCVVDFVAAQQQPPDVRTYADWCVAMFGQTFAETFPWAYTRKYWTVPPQDLSTDWVGSRMYPPRLEEVVRGALSGEQAGDFHYLSSFRYPRRGGFESFMRAMDRPGTERLSHDVVAVDLERRHVRCANGEKVSFGQLVSTMPIDALVRLVTAPQVPDEVRVAADQLLCSSVVLVDVAVGRADLFDHHWFYVYDEDLLISRGHFPHMLSPGNAPAGCGSVQLEVYYSPRTPLPCSRDEVHDRVLRELVTLGILRNVDEVLWSRWRDIPYANVVFTHERATALAVVKGWLAHHGVLLAGRYGEWEYQWTDGAVLSGWRAADAALDRRRAGA